MKGANKCLPCGHTQFFDTPVPRECDWVWCVTCDTSMQLPRAPRKQDTVAGGRKRRLKRCPKSNNGYTKGRPLGTRMVGA